ncbi:MAG: hypothetical protein ACREA2_01495 [Blastocatellia bacterium]
MITRTALLYLSNRHNLKDYFSRFDAFKRITRRFIAGEEIDEAIFAIRDLNALGAAASFDHLGESISSEVEAEAEVREYLRVLGRIESSGIRANVSVKLTQLGLDIDEHLCLHPSPKEPSCRAATPGNDENSCDKMPSCPTFRGESPMKKKLCLHFVRLLPLALVFAGALVPGFAAGKTRTARPSSAKQSGHKCRGRMMTRERIAATRGLSIKEFNRILSARLLTPEEVCTVSTAVLNRAKEKAMAPRPDRPDESLLYRLLDLRDERGEIAPS